MAQFSRPLLAIDLNAETDALIHRAYEVCAEALDRLHVVHVIRKGMHDIGLRSLDICCDPHASRMLDHTFLRIRDSLRRHGIEVSSDRIHLLHGEPAFEIKKLAGELDVDLVIVGSHTKEDDWLQLPGATTNCVIQGISSDVMAVKV